MARTDLLASGLRIDRALGLFFRYCRLVDSNQDIVLTAIALLAMAGGLGFLVGMPVANFLGERLSQFFLGSSAERFDKPQPLIGKATAKAIRGDVEGARADLEEMLIEHPLNAELHLRLIELAYGPMTDKELGRRLTLRALRTISDEHERETIKTRARSLRDAKSAPDSIEPPVASQTSREKVRKSASSQKK